MRKGGKAKRRAREEEKNCTKFSIIFHKARRESLIVFKGWDWLLLCECGKFGRSYEKKKNWDSDRDESPNSIDIFYVVVHQEKVKK